jgi:hypothetical protein
MIVVAAAAGKPDPVALAAILENTDPGLAVANSEMVAATTRRTRWGVAAQWALLGALMWSMAVVLLSPCIFY